MEAARSGSGAGATSYDAGPIGGQALIEGVMMRRGRCWGAAVRRADGTIVTTRRELPPSLDAVRRVPLLRGVAALGESVVLGTRATLWAASERDDPTDADGTGGYSRIGLVLSTVVAVALALGLFGLLPGVLMKAAGVDGRFAFNLGEGLVRVAFLVGYMWLLSRSAAMRRVFAFHGAEHMTIHAFEHGVPLEPSSIRGFDRRHPRCGTSFLLIVAVTAVAVHVLVGTPGWGLLVASRVLGLPLVAALAYEVIRFAGRHQTTWFGRVLMAPGSWLQTITTRPPDDDQIEVAVAALAATLDDTAPSLAPEVVTGGVAR